MPRRIEVTYQYDKNTNRVIVFQADSYRITDDGALEIILDIPPKSEHGPKGEELVGLFNFDKVISVIPERETPDE